MRLPLSTEKRKTIQTRLVAVLIGFLIGAIVILVTGHDPIGAYATLFYGAFGSVSSITETLVKTIPLTLAGLGMTIAFKCKVINIGGEGQIYLGALGATVFTLAFGGAPPAILFLLGLVGGFVGGGSWAAIPGILKVKLNVNEVLTSMMMNFVAYLLIDALITGGGPLHDPLSPGWPASPPIPRSVWLPILLPRSRMHAGIIIAIISVLVVYVLLERTTLGYQIKAVGANPKAAKTSGMNVSLAMAMSMLLSGGLAGLAGMVEVFGVQHRLVEGFSSNYGYTAVMVALLGKLNPFAVALSAFLFGALIVGADTMARQTGVAIFITFVLQGLIVVTAVALEHVRKKDLVRLINRCRIWRRHEG